MSCEVDGSIDYCYTVVTNPDISGIGLRVAVYTQAALGMGVVSLLPYNERAFRNTCRNLYLMSITLIIGPLIQWTQGSGVSLLDGLIVTMLTTILTSFAAINGPYARTLGLSINMTSFLFTSLWCYWGLQIWAKPSYFGLPAGTSPAECPASINTVFVVLGYNVSVEDERVRGLAICFFAVGAFEVISALGQCIKWSIWYMLGSAKAAKANAARMYARELGRMRKHPKKGARHITRYGGVVSMIYMIVTTEQIVLRNNSVTSSLNNWPLSQSLAFVVLAEQMMECITYLKEEVAKRQGKGSLGHSVGRGEV